MSKIIRNARIASPIFVGEKLRDRVADQTASEKLARLFPLVSIVTDPDGDKLIFITEIDKFEHVLEEEKQRAYQEGFRKGEEAGQQKGLVESRKIVGQFSQAVSDAVNQRAAMLEEARQKILELVIQVSRKVTCDAVDIDQEVTITMISRVIDQLVDKSRLTVKVHPDLLPVVEQSLDRFLSGSTDIKELKIAADPRVRLGGCFIETPSGDIDARLESQFDVIQGVIQSSGEQE